MTQCNCSSDCDFNTSLNTDCFTVSLVCRLFLGIKLLRRFSDRTAAAKQVDDRRMLLGYTPRQSRWTPLAVNTRGSRWTNALVLTSTMVFDLLVVAGATDVVTVFELARNADQQYLTVRYRARVLAVI